MARVRCMFCSRFVLTASLVAALHVGVSAANDRTVTADSPSARGISPDDMQRVYDEVKTPFKYGIVLRPDEHETIDCPSVFRFGGKWYMAYIAIKDKIGYETFLAGSEDLLRWKKLGKILP